MILIGISGKRGVGKDLLASFLAKKYGFVNVPFASTLKEEVRKTFGLTFDHTDGRLKESPTNYESFYRGTKWTPREIMISYGQFFRKFDPLWWVKRTFKRIQDIQTFHQYGDAARISISDVRFKNEADYIKEQGGFLVRLERKPELNIYKELIEDLSEIDLDNYDKFDLRLSAEENILPDDLKNFADDVMGYIGAIRTK